MSTEDEKKLKKQEPAEYSADYRGAHPQKPKAKRKPHPSAPPKKLKTPVPKAPKPKEEIRKNDKPEQKVFLPAEEKAGDELLTKWDDGAPEASLQKKPARRRSGKYRYGIFVGTVVLLLALTGVVFLAAALGQQIHRAATDDTKLREYDKMLSIAVAQDPQPFASPDKADPDFVLNASLWKAISENSASYTHYDDIGRTVIPLGDVADACGELFGPKCQLHPKSPATETFFTYDSAKAQFHVALYSLENTYVPYTESAKEEGDSVVLHVGYIPPTDPSRAASSGASSSGKPKPSKYMDYVIKTGAGKKEYIYAVRKG